MSGSEGHLGKPFIQSSPKYSSNYPQPRQGTLFLPPTAIPKPLRPFNACLNREVQDSQNTQLLLLHANKWQGKKGNWTIASLGKTRAQLALGRGAVKQSCSPRGSGNDLCRPRGAKWCSRGTGTPGMHEVGQQQGQMSQGKLSEHRHRARTTGHTVFHNTSRATGTMECKVTIQKKRCTFLGRELQKSHTSLKLHNVQLGSGKPQTESLKILLHALEVAFQQRQWFLKEGDTF